MKNELFDNGVVKIEVPEKKKDINIKVDSLTKVVFQIWETINCFKRVTSKGKKDEATINSLMELLFWIMMKRNYLVVRFIQKKLSNLIYFLALIKMELLVQFSLLLWWCISNCCCCFRYKWEKIWWIFYSKFSSIKCWRTGCLTDYSFIFSL